MMQDDGSEKERRPHVALVWAPRICADMKWLCGRADDRDVLASGEMEPGKILLLHTDRLFLFLHDRLRDGPRCKKSSCPFLVEPFDLRFLVFHRPKPR